MTSGIRRVSKWTVGVAVSALMLGGSAQAFDSFHHAPPPPAPPPVAPPVVAPPRAIVPPTIVMPNRTPPPPTASAPSRTAPSPAPRATPPAPATTVTRSPAPRPAPAPTAAMLELPADAPLPPPAPRGTERAVMTAEREIVRLEAELASEWEHDYDAARAWLADEIAAAEEDLAQHAGAYTTRVAERADSARAALTLVRDIIRSAMDYAEESTSSPYHRLSDRYIGGSLQSIDAILDGSRVADRLAARGSLRGDPLIEASLADVLMIREAEGVLRSFAASGSPHVQSTHEVILAALEKGVEQADWMVEKLKEAVANHRAAPARAQQRLTLAEAAFQRAQANRQAYRDWVASLSQSDRLRMIEAGDERFRTVNTDFWRARSELEDAKRAVAGLEHWNAQSIANASDHLSEWSSKAQQARSRLSAYVSATESLAGLLAPLGEQGKLETDLLGERIVAARRRVTDLTRWTDAPDGSRDLVAFAQQEGADIGALRGEIEADLADARTALVEAQDRARAEALEALEERATALRLAAEERARLADEDDSARLEQEAEAARLREEEIAAVREALEEQEEAARLAAIEAEDAQAALASALEAAASDASPHPAPETARAEIEDAEGAETSRRRESAQEDIEYFMRQRDRALAELRSLDARGGGGGDEARGWIASRLSSYDLQIAAAQAALKDAGGSFEGYRAEPLSGFDPYRLTETDRTLQELTARIRELDDIGAARQRALQTIELFADTDDAIGLRDMLYRIGDIPEGSAADLARTTDALREFRRLVYDTRFAAPMEQVMVEAFEEEITAAEYEVGAGRMRLGSAVAISLISLGTTGAALAGSAAAAGVSGSVGYTALAYNAATGAIDGYARDGASGALTGVARETLPVNTIITIYDGRDKPPGEGPGGWSLGLAILQDLGNAASAYSALRDIQTSVNAGAARSVASSLEGTDAIAHRAWQLDQARGRELVTSYQQATFQAAVARASGATDAVAEARVDRLVAQINSSDQAKLFLKAQPSNVQRAFDGDLDGRLLQVVDERFEAGMLARGWSPQAVREFRNQASAGSARLDRDLGIVEPSLADKIFDPAIGADRLKYAGANDPDFLLDTRAFREGLTRHGAQASLDDWARDAAEVYDDAYRGRTLELTTTPGEEALQFSAASARQHLTTSRDREAFRDVAVLLNNPEAVPFSRTWSGQTADVTRIKVDEGITGLRALGLEGAETTVRLPANLNAGSTLTEIQIAGRELIKDLDTKVVPAIMARNRELSEGGGSLLGFTGRQEREIAILRAMASGDGGMSPVVADRLLRRDGGGGLGEAMARLSGTIEFVQKL